MILFDVNVLVYVHREDAPDHKAYLEWFQEAVDSDAPYGISDLVSSGFLRVVTHPRVFRLPTPMKTALAFIHALREQPNAVLISPGARHWEIFTHLCRTAGTKGNLVADAYLAALAIESGSEWSTTDRDYSRFPGLRWRHPLGKG
ncbi:MAG: DNA-binding protein [Armatimonadetes bacterium RBG_16_67_12]|nr:MAG: DNA-binding protein [Armatimonadetes bacterium RBG_16_67_12]